MLEIEKWTKNKPIFTSTMAIDIAVGSPHYYQTIQKIKKGSLDLKTSQVPSIEKWISFYKNHRPLTATIFNNFYSLGGTAKNAVDFHCILIELQKQQATKTRKDEIPEATQKVSNLNELFDLVIEKTVGLDQYLENFFHEIFLELKNIENEEENEKITEIIQHYEMTFFMKVIAPCWLFYRTNPTILLRKARLGDEDAIDKLLRIDKSIIADPLLSKHFAQSSFKKNKNEFNIYLKALRYNPKGKPSLLNVKFFFAGLISVFSEVSGYRLLEPDIRALFNAIAIDSGQDQLIDADLPPSPEAFLKAIQRERSYWLPSFKLDKK